MRSKVGELNSMWLKHMKRTEVSEPSQPEPTPNTPKKLLGSLLEPSAKTEVVKMEEELMSSRLKEVEAMAELKELRLKVMDLETQTHVLHNQLKRQTEESHSLSEHLDNSKKSELDLQSQLR